MADTLGLENGNELGTEDGNTLGIEGGTDAPVLRGVVRSSLRLASVPLVASCAASLAAWFR